MIQALRSGILIMIIPPTLGSIGMIFIVHRKRNQFKRTTTPANLATTGKMATTKVMANPTPRKHCRPSSGTITRSPNPR